MKDIRKNMKVKDDFFVNIKYTAITLEKNILIKAHL